ncbi:DNA methylase [Kibdelosporangium phytohabitans]|uniref:DNA (cytosine-5-)-methyltransferase n=2 Tax=Kibdelosporangium phytohabitans TaxID=860235 RepID=A0A0N7F5Z2_9PSEU|nr:DNA cytosine methyltransferase [Kibdelosporangium phytohabitans]ALG15583.1 DNA methylase [Kibdelosporangium phytohabitans]
MVDLFAGPGGLDVAAHWMGIAVEGIEIDPNPCETRAKAGLATKASDVRNFGPKDYPDATVLAGGPPCQTYTVAGGGAGRRALNQVLEFVESMAEGKDVSAELKGLDDERTGLVLEPLRWILEAHDLQIPYESIVLEQVPAVKPVWDAYKEVLEGIQYTVDVGILHTEEFGVPQTRRRAILVARRNNEVALPKPTHRRYRKGGARSEGDPRLLPWVTMGEALRRPEQFNVISNYGTGGDPKARGRRSSDEPSATVTGKISRNRLVTRDLPERELPRLNEGEMGRLQTFPVDYPWQGKELSQQIGNAIPPRLAAHVLAAALGLTFDTEDLDAAVEANWDAAQYDPPLLPTKPI